MDIHPEKYPIYDMERQHEIFYPILDFGTDRPTCHAEEPIET